MATYTTRLAGRNTRELVLTSKEAEAMYQLGFRFSEYSPEHGRCRVAPPIQLLILRDRDELIIEQP